MKPHCNRILTLMMITLLTIPAAYAGEEKKMMVAIATDSFTLEETDISLLAVGEAKTIATGSGQVIDILRTPDGAEVYIDGELIEPGLGHDEGDHEMPFVRKHVEIICGDDDDAECEKHVMIKTHGDASLHHDLEIDCNDEEGQGACDEHLIKIIDGDFVDIEEFHEEHGDGKIHKVIVIKSGEDAGS